MGRPLTRSVFAFAIHLIAFASVVAFTHSAAPVRAATSFASGGECSNDRSCDDGDPCTADTCGRNVIAVDPVPTGMSLDSPYSVFATDIDGDGDTDVLSASYGDSKIVWWENLGSASFKPHVLTNIAHDAVAVFAADVDGDGDTDVLSAAERSGRVDWYENLGLAGFRRHLIEFNGAGSSLFAVDLDDDGDTDVLSTSRRGDRIVWHENDGSQNFTPHTIATDADVAVSVFAIDVDDDGDTDVLSAAVGAGVAWYENDGSENFTAHPITTGAALPSSVFGIDIDGDGDIDAVSSSAQNDTVAWYENDGSEGFTAHTITTSADAAFSVFAIDVDGDTDIDVLSASSNDDSVRWYENDGSENFASHTITATADWARSVFAIDVDGDGDIDVLSAASNEDSLEWYENNGLEEFAAHRIDPGGAGPRGPLRAADIDGDGDTDVLSASWASGEIVWHANDGLGNFVTHIVATGVGSVSSAFVSDIDLDGDADLVVVSGNVITLYENDGSQNFTTRALVSGLRAFRSVHLTDMDGDGDADFLFVRNGEAQWEENDGSGNFIGHLITVGSELPAEVSPADVDGDGDIDVVWASTATGSKVAWYENDGAENFAVRILATRADPIGSANAIFGVDVDGDGDTDVLTTTTTQKSFFGQTFPSTWSVVCYENDGSENFSARKAVTDSSLQLTTDMDGDGDLDLLVVLRGREGEPFLTVEADAIAWSENDGSGNFTTRVIADHDFSSSSMTTADIDGDGDRDIVAASPGDGAIVWYENGEGSLGPPVFRTCSNTLLQDCTCGNQIQEGFETCDDGNAVNGDLCSSGCEVELDQFSPKEKCVNSLNVAGAKVAKAQGKKNLKCVKDASRDKLDGGTAKQCLNASQPRRDKVSNLMTKTRKLDIKDCEIADTTFRRIVPDFGYTGSTAVNHSAFSHEIGVVADVFGDDPDPVIIDSSIDAVGASCQATVLKFTDKILGKGMKAFRKCKKPGLRDRFIRSGTSLREVCLEAVRTDTSVARAVSALSDKTAKKCSGIDLDAAFPGDCLGALDFVTCLAERANCRTCLMVAKMDALAADCDVFDDDVANASCPPN